MATTLMRDGAPYDLRARRRLAHEASTAQSRRQPRDVPRPPGPNGWALIARQTLNLQSPLDLFTDIAARYPRLSYSRLPGGHLYVLNDAELIDEVYRRHGRALGKSRPLQVAKILLGNGLLTDEGESHLRHRRLVAPAFHRDRIRGYSTAMVEAVLEHEASWRPGMRVDMAAQMSTMTLDIVGRTLFGADLRSDASQLQASLRSLLDSFPRLILPAGMLMSRIPGTRLHRGLADSVAVDDLVARMIEDHRRLGDTGDLLSMLIAATDEGVSMDDAQLRDEAVTLVLAGHGTTAMTLTWTWHLLAAHPREARELRAELHRVLGGRAPNHDDVEQLPVTRAVIAESMRLFPPAWTIGRMTTQEITIDGWTVPAGSGLMASQYAMHRNPRYWPSALTFRPSRWLTPSGEFSEKAPGQPTGAWFPFGFGNRMCIGDRFALTETVLALATLAQRWAPAAVPGHPVRIRPAITLRPDGGLPMVVERAPSLG